MNRPFKLSHSKSLSIGKKKEFKNGGQWGNREGKINELIQDMI